MVAWMSYSHALAPVIVGHQAAAAIFAGVFAVPIPDNLKSVVAVADAVNHSAPAGGSTISARPDSSPIRSASVPKDLPRVARVVH